MWSRRCGRWSGDAPRWPSDSEFLRGAPPLARSDNVNVSLCVKLPTMAKETAPTRTRSDSKSAGATVSTRAAAVDSSFLKAESTDCERSTTRIKSTSHEASERD